MNNEPDRRIDVVVLAGTSRNPKRLINNRNKAFLEISGTSLVSRVMEQVMACSDVNRVTVVGPREDLERELLCRFPQNRLKIIHQRSRMLENVWAGFIATFPDGNNLPRNREIDTVLLGGRLPIRRKPHLYILKSVFAAVAAQVTDPSIPISRHRVGAAIDARLNAFRDRHERMEWFLGKIDLETILREGNVLHDTPEGILFIRKDILEYFRDWETRLNKPILVIPADIPLLTHEAITDFLDRCTKIDGDFFFSVAIEDVLADYYRRPDGKNAFIRPYLWLREAKIRAANLILVKPNLIGNKQLIQESFGIRKMTEWSNVFALIWKLIKQKDRWQTVRLAVGFQLAAVLWRNGYGRWAESVRLRLRSPQLEAALSRMFMTRFRLIPTPYGGVSLDVDCESDYDLLREYLPFFKTIQESRLPMNRQLVEHLFRIPVSSGG